MLSTALLVLFAALLALDFPRLPLNARLADAVFVALAAVAFRWPRPRWRRQGLDVLVLLYLAGSLPSLIASDDRVASSTELVREIYLVAVYAVTALAVHNGMGRTVAVGIAAGGTAMAGMAVAFILAHGLHPFAFAPVGDVMELPYVGAVLRVKAFAASESMLACAFTAAAPMALGLASSAPRSWSRSAWLTSACLMGGAAVFTFSHSLAGLAVAITVGAWPLLQGRTVLRRAALTATVALVVAMNLAATASVRRVSNGTRLIDDTTVYHHEVGEGQLTIGPLTLDYGVMSYLRLKEVAWSAFLEHPLTGVGLDRFHQVTARAQRDGRLTPLYQATDPHSTLLGRLAETGLPGGITLVALWIGIAGVTRTMLQQDGPNRWLVQAASAALAGLLVSSINVDVMNFRFLWVIIGLLRGISTVRTARSG